MTISTDSLGPITVTADGSPPTARSHREWQQNVLAIGCRVKHAGLSWGAVAQGHPAAVSPFLSIWQVVHEQAVPTTVKFEEAELEEHGALIHNNSAGGVAPEAQADGAWHQMGNSSNRGMVTLVAVDSMHPGGLIIGSEMMDMAATPHQAALGMKPRWTKKSKPMEPNGMRVVLQGALERSVFFEWLTIDGDSTALAAVADLIKKMNTYVAGGGAGWQLPEPLPQGTHEEDPRWLPDAGREQREPPLAAREHVQGSTNSAEGGWVRQEIKVPPPPHTHTRTPPPPPQ